MRKIKSFFSLILWLIVLFFAANFLLSYYLPLAYEKEITEISIKHGVDKALICALIKTESSFNKNAISNKYAIGLTQLTPETIQYVSEKYDLSITVDKIFDPYTNIDVGVTYLKDLYQRFNDMDIALMAYNAGPTVVRRWINEGRLEYLDKDYSAVPYEETRNYVKKVNERKTYYEKYLKSPYRIPKFFKDIMTRIRTDSKDMIKKAKEKLGESIF